MLESIKNYKINKNILYIFYLLVLVFILFLYFYFLYSGGTKSGSSYILPKKIWCYWTGPIDENIIMIQKYNSRHLPNWDIIFLNDSTIKKYIPSIPKSLNSVVVQAKADWIRLYLLKTYGGCWLDASIIINSEKELERLYETSKKMNSQLTAFSLDKGGIPLCVENSFLMAPKESRIITEWFTEYNLALKMGFLEYKRKIIKEGIQCSAIYTSEEDTYLTQHACFMKIHQTGKIQYPMFIQRGEETLFKLQILCGWNYQCVMDTIRNKNPIDIPFIKITRQSRQTGVDLSNYLMLRIRKLE